MKYISLFLIGVAASGCINRATATLAPGAGFSHVNTFYVVHQPRDKEKLHQMISDNLSMKGYRSTAGPELAGVLQDRRNYHLRGQMMWDITLYLLELTVTVIAHWSTVGRRQLLPYVHDASITTRNDRRGFGKYLGSAKRARRGDAGPPEITVQPVKDSSRLRPNFANQRCEVKSWPAREECSGSAWC